MIIYPDPLTRVTSEILQKMGSVPEEADLVAGSLVRANLMGHDSHGVGLVPTYLEHFRKGLLKPGTAVEIVKDDGALMMFDGGRGFGRRVGGEAMAAATERCRETGVVVMTLRNAHHLGRIGAYGELAMARGLISLHFVNAVDHHPSVAPWGGIEARYITNPVCIAVPGTEETPPTLLDMATSRVAIGKVRVAMVKGRPMPEGYFLDADGMPSTDPSVMYAEPRGALLPFGEHKGSGLALMCELLAGGLSGGGTIQPGNPRQSSIVNNMFAVLVDPGRLVDIDWLRAEVDATISYVKSARPASYGEEILVAGDPERMNMAERMSGGIEIDDNAWGQIREAAAAVGVDGAKFAELTQ